MTKVRRLIGPVALACVFLHVSVIVGTSVLLLTTGSAASDIICTCAHGGDHTSCPMHHKPADSARCRMQNTQSDLGLALLSMLGPLTLPVAATVVVDRSSPRAIEYRSPFLSDRSAPPEPPPPRS